MQTTEDATLQPPRAGQAAPAPGDLPSPGRNGDVEAFSSVHPFHAGRRLFAQGQQDGLR